MKKKFYLNVFSAGFLVFGFSPCNASYYAGLSAGYNIGAHRTKADFNEIVQGDKETENVIQGFQGQLYVGQIFKKEGPFFLGVELNVDYSNAKGRDRSPIFANRHGTSYHAVAVRYHHGFGPMVKGGISFNEGKNAYLKLGPAIGAWSVRTTTDTLDGRGQIVPQNASRSSNLFGLKVAVGAEAEVIQGVYAGFEYGYARYQKISLQKTASTGEHFSYQVEPSMNTFMLTLTRKF